MKTKKIILILLILFVLLLAGFLGFVFWGSKFLPKQTLSTSTPSPEKSPTLTLPLEKTKMIFKLSEESKKILSLRENFKSGISATYQEIPLASGVKETDAWTFLKPVEGILYTASTSKAESISFYEAKLKEKGWRQDSKEQVNENTTYLNFVKDEKKLNIFIIDKAPNFLPKELGLKGGAYISLHFSP